METTQITEEQAVELQEGLLAKMKGLLKEVFRSEKPKQGEELKDYLLSQIGSEEDREALEEVFDEITVFYRKRNEFEKSGKEIAVWYEEEIEKIVRSLKPNATEEDIDKVKEAIARQIDFEIEETAMTLEELEKTVEETMKKEDGHEE